MAQGEVEAAFLAVPTSASVRETMTATSSKPCMAGSPGAAAVATYLGKTLRDLGFKVDIREYDVYLPYPKRIAVTVHDKVTLELSLLEPLDGVSAPEALTWNAYSASGTVHAPVVPVGTGSDAELAGLDIKGKVVLMRYGPLYRGAQVAAVERKGAAAVIFYSDPKDEPKRPPESVQRGTVLYYWQYTGDPQTPGIAATRSAARGSGTDVSPKIPVLTVNSVEARKLLDLIPANSTGPITDVTVELDGAHRTIRDVIATLPGDTDEMVVLGNHYDGWVYGAVDPHSGTATLVEIARGLGKLVSAGWKPKRTIMIGFWDAEEFGVIGSTEWVEDSLARLQQRAVAYFNIDTIKAGALTLQGAPELRQFLTSCTSAVIDPLTNAPFAPAFKDIGIGSDWTAFLHHAGVTSVQWLTGAGPGTYSVWHSGLDDVQWAATKADPEFGFTPAYARVMGLCALRLATADIVPFNWSDAVTWMTGALDQLATTTKLSLDRTDLDQALRALAAIADRARRPSCNAALPQVTRAFLAPDGLVDRPWYRNLITGPNPDNGYGALLLPELAAARTQPALDRATERLVMAIRHATTTLSACAGPAQGSSVPVLTPSNSAVER